MAADNRMLLDLVSRLEDKMGDMSVVITRQIEDLKMSTMEELKEMRQEMNNMECRLTEKLSSIRIVDREGEAVPKCTEEKHEAGMAMVPMSVPDEEETAETAEEERVPEECNESVDDERSDSKSDVSEVRENVSGGDDEIAQRVDITASSVHDSASEDGSTVVSDRETDTVEEIVTVKELRESFWWVEESNVPRWPVGCIICDAKIPGNVKQVISHDEGSRHNSRLLQCNDLKKLEQFEKINRLSLSTYLSVGESKVFFLTPQRKLPCEAKEFVEGITFFNVSFQSHNSHLTELALLGGKMCICFQKSLLTKSQRLSESMEILKGIMEDPNIFIAGKDVWMMMVVLLKDYNIECRNCYSIHDIQLARRPIGMHVMNPIVTLVANAMAIREVLPTSSAFNEADGPLNITEENKTIVRSLGRHGVYIDEERNAFNQSHWRCYFKDLQMNTEAREMLIWTVPSREKLRPHSEVRIHSKAVTHTGVVKGSVIAGMGKVAIRGAMPQKGSIVAVDIEKFNELNIKLLETKIYAVKYLSGKRRILNQFQKFFIGKEVDAVESHPLKIDALSKIHQKLGKTLNASQKKAVENSTHAISLVHGPPGTGKTTVLAAMVGKLLENGKGVLVLSETNYAIKQVCESLLKNKICTRKQITLLVSKEFYEGKEEEYDSEYTRVKLKNRYTPVLLMTLSKAKLIRDLAVQHFRDADGNFQYRDAALIDESGRITEISIEEVLPVLDKFKRMAVFGDPKQGTPFSSTRRKLQSLISLLQEAPSSVVKKVFLDQQYRMVYDIGEMVSETFYEGRVRSRKTDCGKNSFFHNVTGKLEFDNKSAYCHVEAELCARYAKAFLHKHHSCTVMVICYYYSQMLLLRRLLKKALTSNRLRIGTVDSFQGKEADVSLVSTCAQGGSMSQHLADNGRACVVNSRGRRRVVIIGRRETMENFTNWADAIKHMVKVQGNACCQAALR